MADQIASFYAKIGAESGDFEKAMRGVSQDLDKAHKGFSVFQAGATTAFKGIAAVAVTAFAGLATGIGASVKMAVDFEQGIADVGAMMALTSDETAQLQGHIMDLGLSPTLKVSATEATEAIMALGTAGLTTTQIMGGASEATVLLANATGAQFGNAATIATDVMAQFNIEADDMSAAVSAISGVTVASKFDINDYALAISQAGGVAGSVGVSFDDFNAVIAATSPSFASGSDAGTSFKTFLQRLVPTTSDAKEALIQLGLSTGEDVVTAFFTAEGAMRPMEEIAANLQNAFSGLSESQRIEAASTIFGTDAMRTALSLAEGGDEIIRQMKEAIGNVDAEELAAKRMDTFAGAMEVAQGVMETLGISIGQAFLPVLRPLVEQFTALAQQHGPRLVAFFGDLAARMGDGIQKGIEWAQNVLPPLWKKMTEVGNAIKVVTGIVVQALKPVTDAISKWVGWEDVLSAVALLLGGAMLAAIGGFIAAMAPVIVLVAKVTAVIVALKVAWETNFLGIRDITEKVFDQITDWMKIYSGYWKGDWTKTLKFILENADHIWSEIVHKVTTYISSMVNETRHHIAVWTERIAFEIGLMETKFMVWKNNTVALIKQWAKDMIARFEPVVEWWNKHIIPFVDRGRQIMQGLWDGAKEVWNHFLDWWRGIWRKLTGTVDVKLRIGSPSKEMFERGADTMKGFALGAESSMPMAMEAMGGLATGAMSAGDRAGGAVSTARIEQLLEALIAELRAKNMSVTVNGGGGESDLALWSNTKNRLRI